MIEITNRSTSPYKEVCYIQTYFSDGTVLRGSGTIVGANDVLTALHVVYQEKHGGWATRTVVTPAAYVDDSTGAFSAELGTYGASRVIGYSNNWDTNHDGYLTKFESGHDLALIGLDVNLTGITGYLGFSSTGASGFTGTLLGYPASEAGLMKDTSTATYEAGYPIYSVNDGLGAGASGGPLLDSSNLIRGVLSAGNFSNTLSWYAALTDNNASWLSQQISANDDLLKYSEYRPAGTGISSGTETSDIFYEYQLGFDTNKTSHLYGYQGADQLKMDGYARNYTFSTDAADGTLKVFNTVSGTTTYLHDVNALLFADKTVFVMTEDQAQIARLYSVFNRTPDFDGLAYWTNAHAHGMSFDTIANSFSQSQEFATRYNAVDNAGFAGQLYSTILGRSGEASGIAYWKSLLDQGLSRSDAMIQFTNSGENQQRTEGSNGYIQKVSHTAWTDADLSIQKGVVFGTDSGDSIAENQIIFDANHSSNVLAGTGVDVLYLSGSSQGYRWSADAGATNSVHVSTANGSEQINLRDGNVLSFQDHNVFLLTQSQADIARLYTVLDRVPDIQGMRYWIDAASHGMTFKTIANSFSQSQEFAQRYNAVDNAGFAEQLYGTILNRSGDANGISYWQTQLDHGLSRGDAMIQFTNSTENHGITEGQNGFIQIVGQSDWA
ncbi:hypothetical protein SB14R_00785 [Pseudomonas oryzihabitans]|nr:hypothetical protein NS376_04510 [Pseudomonas psychrotolerans]KTT26972.1 hypothetical protein SB14R_00785 [Pseudomonas psychrotolerans]KTT58379.1 hypothetical protein SB8_08960 [Pseudomonas psychrotolerans]